MSSFLSSARPGLRRVWLALFLLLVGPVQAERIKDLATLQGVRYNPLLGYGLVVGLDGSGDQAPFTVQAVVNMLQQMGMSLPPGVNLQAKNVAGVMVTASLPAFVQAGQSLDVTVSSMGSAKSLRGGTLLMTPLKGADGQVYALAQGNVLVSGAGAAAPGAKAQVNHLNVGRISGGAIVERSVPAELGQGDFVTLELKDSDFGTASRVVEALDRCVGPATASAQNARVIQVQAPQQQDQRVAFLGALEALEVTPAQQAPKVVLNGRTGSIVIGSSAEVSQPAPLSQGQTVVTTRTNIEIKQEPGQLMLLPRAVLLADVVKALNAIGATPQDLLAILQAMKAAGALRAELEVI